MLDQNSAVLSGAAVVWSSSLPGVATVSAQGLVTAVGNGNAQITARSGSVSASVTITIMDDSMEREALTALYNSTNGPSWRNTTNWLSEMPLDTWYGISTSSDGRVWYLNLRSNSLQGPIPKELAHLQKLELLNLGNNSLTGTIPVELAQLQKLEVLWLGGNQLEGSIPSEIGQFGKLEYLILGGNQLTGSIPQEIGRLRTLKSLYLDLNQLTGTVPSEIGQLTNLKDLVISENTGLDGPLPSSFLNLKLEKIRIHDTTVCVPPTTAFRQWADRIPDSRITYCPDPNWDPLVALYNSTAGAGWTISTNWLSTEPLDKWHGLTTDANGNVTVLSLADNSLSGTIPGQLGDLAGLKVLNLANNTDLFGVLPRSILKRDLERLMLDGTRVCMPSDLEFRQWLNRIPYGDVTVCAIDRPDYDALAAIFHYTNGPQWNNSENWLSEQPLNMWYGVTVDPNGQVTDLRLEDNNLQGMIPAALGRLQRLTNLNFRSNKLTGSIPPELAQLQDLRYLDLRSNKLTGSIPPELAQLQKIEVLNLGSNRLTGSIPPELAQLQKIEVLNLGFNRLTDAIPSELGRLQRLRELTVIYNRFTGSIPPEFGLLLNLSWLKLEGNMLSGEIPAELGQLQKLTLLVLSDNELTGSIPPELGQLQNLRSLYLAVNGLTGQIPPELGQLRNLEVLSLFSNNMAGSIPPELGQLRNLLILSLFDNELTGSIPPELGRLQKLEELRLSSNRLSGNIPSSFGELANLRDLILGDNTDMSGMLPSSLTGLDLASLQLGGTRLCAPQDPSFQDWLRQIPNRRVANCAPMARFTAYLTQATQSLAHPVSLVAGEDTLLRVFITAQNDEEVVLPPVRVTFYQSGTEIHSIDITGQGTTVPRQIDEGDLSASINATVPGSIIVPGLEMVVEIDPEGTLDWITDIGGRLPPTGRIPVDVLDVPPFHLTMVPFLWTEDPDRSILTQLEGLNADSDLFRYTRDILPVRDITVDVREPVWTSFDPVNENLGLLLRETQMIHTVDGASEHYMGIVRDIGGIAKTPGFVSASSLHGLVIAHELGHNFSLGHAPCGTAGEADYPYPDGTIGAWGYDILQERLVSPDTYDLMTYCGPKWISDYNFNRALSFRVLQAATLSAAYTHSTRGLLLWGGVGEGSELVLEPAFVVNALEAGPELDGTYRIVGEDEDGGTLFSLRFGMAEIADANGEGGSFAFVVPVRPDWSRRLARVTLAGPEGVATLGKEDDRSAALLLDPVDGQVKGILRDWREPGVSDVSARSVLPEPGLKVVISRGIPDRNDW